jgi:hypothetical protein
MRLEHKPIPFGLLTNSISLDQTESKGHAFKHISKRTREFEGKGKKFYISQQFTNSIYFRKQDGQSSFQQNHSDPSFTRT